MESVIIDFSANTAELTKAIDLLVKLGQVDQKTADEFKKANAVYAERKVVTDQATKSSANLGKTISDTGKQSEKAFDGAKKSISGLDSALKSIGQGIAAAFAVQKIIAFGEASVQAFQEAEKNALLLKSAVSVNGGLQQDFEELIAQSAELQKVTIFSDDAIQQAQTAALQFGLTKDQVKALIPVITDFASATGQDLQTALDGVIQGINGVGRGLKIYGVTIDENGTRQSRLAEITDQLTKKFDGQAKAVGETASGAYAKYANQLDDMQEKVGERLSPLLLNLKEIVFSVADGFGILANAIFGFEEEVKSASQSNQQMIAGFTKEFANLSGDQIAAKINVLTGALKEAQKEAEGLSAIDAQSANQRIQEYATQITALQKILNLRAQGVDTVDEETKAIRKLADISRLTDKELQELKKTFNSLNGVGSLDAIDAIDKEVEKRAKARGKKQVDNTKKVADDEAKIRKELADKEFAQDEENLKKFVAARKEALVKQNLSSEELEKQLTQLELQELELRLKNLQDYGKDTGDIEKQIADFRVKNYLDANKKIQDSNDEMFKAYLQALEDNEKADKAAADLRIERQKEIANAIVDGVQQMISLISQASNNYYSAQLDAIEKNKDDVLKSYDEQADANEELHSKNKRGDRAYEAEKKRLESERLAAEKKADKEKRKIIHDQAVFNKSVALAQSILNTALAVTNAITTGDPYTAALRAAIVGAIGAAEIAVIAAQPIPGYAKGKERIEGKGTETSDDVPARLSVGERVVKASTNRKYFPILSAIHHERFDAESMNQLAKFTPETLKQLSKVDPMLLRDLATMQPVFMKHISAMPEMTFRNDITPVLQARHDRVGIVSRETESAPQVNEWDITRALDRGTHLKEGTIKQLAKAIGNEVKEKKNSRKAWR